MSHSILKSILIVLSTLKSTAEGNEMKILNLFYITRLQKLESAVVNMKINPKHAHKSLISNFNVEMAWDIFTIHFTIALSLNRSNTAQDCTGWYHKKLEARSYPDVRSSRSVFFSGIFNRVCMSSLNSNTIFGLLSEELDASLITW